MAKSKDLEFKVFLLIIKRDGKQVETREIEAFNRDYARGLADMIETSENCTITVKAK